MPTLRTINCSLLSEELDFFLISSFVVWLRTIFIEEFVDKYDDDDYDVDADSTLIIRSVMNILSCDKSHNHNDDDDDVDDNHNRLGWWTAIHCTVRGTFNRQDKCKTVQIKVGTMVTALCVIIDYCESLAKRSFEIIHFFLFPSSLASASFFLCEFSCKGNVWCYGLGFLSLWSWCVYCCLCIGLSILA